MPDPHGHIDVLIRQAELPVGQGQAQVDFGCSFRNSSAIGSRWRSPKANRCGHVQSSTQRAVIAASLPLCRVQFLQNAA